MRKLSRRESNNPLEVQRYLDEVADKTTELEEQVRRPIEIPQPLTMDEIRDALAADGTHALPLDGLSGRPIPTQKSFGTSLPDANDYMQGDFFVITSGTPELWMRNDSNPPGWTQII